MRFLVLLSLLWAIPVLAEDYPCNYKIKSFMGDYIHPNGEKTTDFFGNYQNPDKTKVKINMLDMSPNNEFSYKLTFVAVKDSFEIKQVDYQFKKLNILIQYTVSKDGSISNISCQDKNWK